MFSRLVVKRFDFTTKSSKHGAENEMHFKPAPVKGLITVADLEKIDIRIGRILTVEDLEGSDKLVKLTVSFGDHNRTVLAGIKQERQHPREIQGMQALFVVNLQAKKMLGATSEAMLFDIGFEDGLTPVLAVPEKEIPDGARVG